MQMNLNVSRMCSALFTVNQRTEIGLSETFVNSAEILFGPAFTHNFTGRLINEADRVQATSKVCDFHKIFVLMNKASLLHFFSAVAILQVTW